MARKTDPNTLQTRTKALHTEVTGLEGHEYPAVYPDYKKGVRTKARNLIEDCATAGRPTDEAIELWVRIESLGLILRTGDRRLVSLTPEQVEGAAYNALLESAVAHIHAIQSADDPTLLDRGGPRDSPQGGRGRRALAVPDRTARGDRRRRGCPPHAAGAAGMTLHPTTKEKTK